MSDDRAAAIEFELDGRAVSATDGCSLLEAMRDHVGVRGPKDGCSPQGQCGCCTVLVDGSARVACVTPVARVRGRSVTTIDGIEDAGRWAAAFTATGASQCGFCTPGIIARLSTLTDADLAEPTKVDRALLAHLCRCTGWQTIHEACDLVVTGQAPAPVADTALAEQRAELEGGTPQLVGPEVALGRGGFADDTAPLDALVAVRGPDGSWAVGESLTQARVAAGKVQGRRTTAAPSWPVELPDGDWHLTLQTTWVEPAYLEPDAAWCEPGGEPASSLGNGGAFGGKTDTDAGAIARRLADEHGRPVRVLWSREDVVRFGPKRPPLAVGLRADGTGVARVARPAARSEQSPDAESLGLPEAVSIEWVDVAGPPVSLDLRGAVWAEVAAAHAVLASDDGSPVVVRGRSGGEARATIDVDDSGAETVRVEVAAGAPLDATVLRSYCIGAAHMALGMVRSESLSVDADGEAHDLTIRSFGVLRAVETPTIEVVIEPSDDEPVMASDAVFAAVLSAAWRHAGLVGRWPVG